MKKTKKTFTPDYTLDFSKINDYDDLVMELIKNRVIAGKTIDSSDLFAFSTSLLNKYLEKNPQCTIISLTFPERLPWYKRFWRWLTRKK